MATSAQLIANRENSKYSTGPRTPEGKQISRTNATKHGLSASDPVLPHEDRDAFDALLAQYTADFAPATAHEEFLVYEMVGARWKLDRIERLEMALLTPFTSPDDPETSDALMAQAFTDKNTGTALARLDRYRASLERTYHRCTRELRATRKEQNEADSTQMAEKKFEKLLKKMIDSPPPGYEYQPALVRTENTEDNRDKKEISAARGQ